MSLIEKVTIPLEDRKNMLMPQSISYLKIMGLDDEEFAQLNSELMMAYKTQDGWWNLGKPVPHCQRCHSVIQGPEQLARYHGMTLHQTPCFKDFWKEEREEQYRNNQFMRNYWDRVASLN